jgi:hypothetical protein
VSKVHNFCELFLPTITGNLDHAIKCIQQSGWKKFSAFIKCGAIKILAFVSTIRVKELITSKNTWTELISFATPRPTKSLSQEAKRKFGEVEVNWGEEVQHCIDSWRQIFNSLTSTTVETLPSLNGYLEDFGNSYLKCFGNSITPYIHILVCHTGTLIESHGSLEQYEQQGLENSINIHKASLFRASSKGGGRDSPVNQLSTQMLLRFYRLRYFGHLHCPEILQKVAKTPTSSPVKE